MKNAKFRVRNAEHSKAIQEALFNLGFRWRYADDTICHLDKAFLYAEADSNGRKLISYSGCEGKLSEYDIWYFEKQAMTECDVAYGFICDIVKPEVKHEEVQGLRPWNEIAKARLEEILEAMLRYVKAGKSIPDEWDNEYDHLREALNAYYETAEQLQATISALRKA